MPQKYNKQASMKLFKEAVNHLVRQHEVLVILLGSPFQNPVQPNEVGHILEARAPIFLSAIYAALFNDIVVSIGRLSEDKTFGKADNLVVNRFVEDHPLPPNAPEQAELDALLRKVDRNDPLMKQKFTHVRHKFCAHADLEHSLMAHDPNWPDTQEMKQVVGAFKRIVEIVVPYHGDEDLGDLADIHRDAEGLKKLLMDGMAKDTTKEKSFATNTAYNKRSAC